MSNYFKHFRAKCKPARVAALYLLLASFILSSPSGAQVGLYMRDFEGSACPGMSGCTGDDVGTVPSCSVSCGTGTCRLWTTNDVWLDTDIDNDGMPDATIGNYTKSSGACPELYLTTTVGQKNFIAVRIIFNSDFFPATPSAGSYTYHLKVSMVQASLGIVLNNFVLIADADITFNRTAGNSISALATPTPNCKIAALASGIKDGFVIFLPWTAGANAGHFCLLAELEKTAGTGTFDPAPTRTAAPSTCITADPLTTNSGYWQYVQCNDNVVWRNIDILAVEPPEMGGQGGEWGGAPMEINATILEGVLTTIAVETPAVNQIPFGKAWTAVLDFSKLPQNLQPRKETMYELNKYLREAKWEGDYAKIPLGGDKLVFPALALPPGQKIPIELKFLPVANADPKITELKYLVNVVQYEQQKGKKPEMVGGNSVLLINKGGKPRVDEPKPKPCKGIKCWLDKNKWAYAVIALIVLLLLWSIFRRRKK